MKRSSLLLAIPIAVVILVPLQLHLSLRNEPVPPSRGGPLYTVYPNGMKRYYEFDGSYVLSSELVDVASGKTLAKTFYGSKLVDGEYQLVVAGRREYTLWGRSRWYVFGAVSLWLILTVIVSRGDGRLWTNPIAGTLVGVLLGVGVGWISGQGQGTEAKTVPGVASADPLAGVPYTPGDSRWKAEEERIGALLVSDPMNYDNLVRAGNLKFDMYKCDEAIGFYERARAIRDDSPQVLSDLGVCYRGVDPRKALGLFERAAAMSPNLWQPRFDAMSILYELKDPAGARRWLEELKRLQATVPGIPRLDEWEKKLANAGR